MHRWSDRRKIVESPLFPGYVFVHIPASPVVRLEVLKANGVVAFVGVRGQGIPIPDREIEQVKLLVASNVPLSPHAFLKVGQRVRIRGGSLEGVEGVLVAVDGERKLVVSIQLIQQAISVSLRGYDVEPA